MEHIHFANYLKYPEMIDNKSITELEKIIDRYPYFQTAHVLYLKGIQNRKDILNGSRLTQYQSSTFIADRKILFLLLKGKWPEKTIQPDSETSKLKDSEPVIKQQQIVEIAQNTTSNDDLINSFIKSTPAPKKRTKKKTKNIEKEEVQTKEEPKTEEFITDTLAKIYIKQAYYSKAIQAYEKLSLKYPGKSAYFAAQIENIKSLIKNKT